MDKKWSCPICDYKSGRQSNVGLNIGRKHGNSGVPVLTEFRNTVLDHQAYSPYYSDQYFLGLTRQEFTKDTMQKKEDDSFISTYKFGHRGLAICNEFSRACKLPDSPEKNLILQDSVFKMEQFVSSNPNQIWRDLFKVMTFSKIAPSRSPECIPPKWHSKIIKLLSSQHLVNEDSNPKLNSNVKVAMSSGKQMGKLEIALQTVLEYKKERESYTHEFGDLGNTKKTGKSEVSR